MTHASDIALGAIAGTLTAITLLTIHTRGRRLLHWWIRTLEQDQPMTERHTVDTITSDELDQLYDRIERVRAEADVIEHGVYGDHDVAYVCRAAATRIRTALDETAEPHVYLSTGCRHGNEPFAHGLTGHEYCQGKNGILGSKKPAQCKGETCGARCICSCHTDQPTPAAAVDVRDPCPHCEGSPTRIPRHTMADHMRTHHPEEQQMPDTPTTPCTATISGPTVPDNETITCTVDDIDRHPNNHVGPKRAYGNLLWSDHHAGATPHQASSGEQP